MLILLIGCGNNDKKEVSDPEDGIETQEEVPEKDETPEEADKTTDDISKIGISMPTKSLQRWNQDGSYMQEMLTEAGYEVDLQYAGDNDISLQVSQVENMITSGCDVLVITAIDASSLSEVLKSAEEKNIHVIAYDRLILNTDALSYYVTFDNEVVGELQAQYIVDALDLDESDEPHNIELVAGAPDDNTANFFWTGSMRVLEPYLESGQLIVPSGQTAQEQAATIEYSMEESQKRMENLISAQGYGSEGTELSAVLAVNDSTANGVTNALIAAGLTAENFPVITGQDCDIASMKNILNGTQSMSVFKDTRDSSARVVKMVESIASGQEVEVNDTETYDNGNGIVPAYLCDPVSCTIDNYEELLIESGYYTYDDLDVEP
ncbi:MAG: sugar ABC transporter substrate-binding protein [Clostridiaceae bacterium]|nr:sugar ABC transporter substrate-binding protein [Clostridiaceae bacterium]